MNSGNCYFLCTSGYHIVAFAFFVIHHHLLLISIVFPPKGQNQAYKAKLKCDGLILAFSRENNGNEEEVVVEEEEEEGKQ